MSRRVYTHPLALPVIPFAFLLVLLLPSGVQAGPSSKSGKKGPIVPRTGKLDVWTRENGAGLFKDCAHRSAVEIISKLKRLRSEYSVKADEASREALLANPEFLEMGEVLFPSQLPETLPNRGAFLICDDARQAVLDSSVDTDMKDRVEDLALCYQDAYRLEPPKWTRLFLTCFRDLTRK